MLLVGKLWLWTCVNSVAIGWEHIWSYWWDGTWQLGGSFGPLGRRSTAFSLNNTWEKNFLFAVPSPHCSSQRAGAALSLAGENVSVVECHSADLADGDFHHEGCRDSPACCGSGGIQIKDITRPLSHTDRNPLMDWNTGKEPWKSRNHKHRRSVWNSGRGTFNTALLSGCVCLPLLSYLWSQLLFVKTGMLFSQISAL